MTHQAVCIGIVLLTVCFVTLRCQEWLGFDNTNSNYFYHALFNTLMYILCSSEQLLTFWVKTWIIEVFLILVIFNPEFRSQKLFVFRSLNNWGVSLVWLVDFIILVGTDQCLAVKPSSLTSTFYYHCEHMPVYFIPKLLLCKLFIAFLV